MRTDWRSLAVLAVVPFAAWSCATVGQPQAPAPEPPQDWIATSSDLTQRLGAELKAELTRAMSEQGPIAAIGVCKEKAPAIAARLSQQSGAKVSRTALRVRNPANAPDDLQRALLEQFSGELASGRFQGPLEAAFEIKRGGQVERRYMRAIPMDGVCVTCHGRVLAPDLAAVIAAQYPDDHATGFEPGQLRGAFSVTWPVASLPTTP